MASSERIGASVGSSMNLGFEAPRDAYAVEAAVMAARAANIIRMHALVGDRPDWTPYPVVKTKPLQKFSIADPTLRDHKGRPAILTGWTFTWVGDLPEHVAIRRRRYRQWAEGLAEVYRLLSEPGILTDHALKPDLPLISPWESSHIDSSTPKLDSASAC